MPPEVPARAPGALAGEGARFLAFGLFNTALTYGLYCLLVFAMHPQLAYAIVFALGIALAFAGNAAFVFRAPLRREAFAPYAAFYLAQYALNAGLIHLLMRELGWGPRLALAAALVVVTPLSFLANRRLLAASAERRSRGVFVAAWQVEGRRPGLLVPLLALAAAGAMHAAGFGGFWLGDDVPNLHRAWIWAADGESWARSAALFAAVVPSEGAFYRPLTIASFTANHALAGAAYAGWFAVNFAVHLANVALVAALAFRLAERAGCEGRRAALLAALAFGLAPAVAEGVYWASARADGWLLLCALLAAERWTRGEARADAAAAVLLCVLALGFKESAAVVPLQLVLLAWAWPAPRRGARVLALAAMLALIPAYLAFRALVLGSAWQVYAATGTEADAVSRALAALGSMPAWWSGFTAGSPEALATAWPIALALAAAFALAAARGLRLRLALALAAGGTGMVAATFANLGPLPASGEGGRLLYAPAAWLALALAVALARPHGERTPLAARAGAAFAIAAVLAGTALLHDAVARALAAQESNRRLVAALPAWAEAHPGLTLLVVPDHLGAVVALRNAQGGIALAPLQSHPLLHRVLPTLPGEIGMRHRQLSGGLATRLAEIAPARADAGLLEKLAQPAAARWPETIACWSPTQSRILPMAAPDPADERAWSSAVLESSRACYNP